MDVVIVIKAFPSHKERESTSNPVESKEVRTPEEFDQIEGDFYNRGFYVGYYGKQSGTRLKRAGARYLMVEETKKDNLRSAVLATTSWLEKNRPHIASDLKNARPEVDQRGDYYFVSLGIRGPKGYEYFLTKVNLQSGNVELIDEHR